jgi:hypothetical protein
LKSPKVGKGIEYTSPTDQPTLAILSTVFPCDPMINWKMLEKKNMILHNTSLGKNQNIQSVFSTELILYHHKLENYKLSHHKSRTISIIIKSSRSKKHLLALISHSSM